MLPVNDILLFVDVIKYESFSQAAEKNNLTPAGVSKRISTLEKKLGTKLLIRTTRALALTDAGKLLYDKCQSMQFDMRNIIESVQETHSKPRGQIKIAALPNVMNLVVSPMLNDFMKSYKDIEILINLEKALGPLPPIGEYDVAFRSGKLVDSSAISRLLFQHDYTVCASPAYLKARGVPLVLEDLEKHNCIDCRRGLKGEGNTWTFFDGQEHFDVPVGGNTYTDNALLIRYLALHDVALIYSPSFLVADDINSGKLVPVLTQYKTIENSIYVIHPYSKKNIPKRIKTFIDFVFSSVKVPEIITKD